MVVVTLQRVCVLVLGLSLSTLVVVVVVPQGVCVLGRCHYRR